ncbi:MAG: tetratricopeptide repeat protein [Anaerolineae bacterium]|nr:tetratricopeptide repeat protein [Anaerolineae bacterium]
MATEFIPHEAPVTDVNLLPVMQPGRPVGRDEVLKTLYTHLQDKKAVLLTGEAGVGKTTLAATLAAAYAQQPGGVLWINTGTYPLPSLLVRIGRALGINDVITSEQPAARVGVVATELAQKKPFMVLDNVESAEAVSAFIEKAASGLPLLLLSDSPLEGPWETVELDNLQDQSAVMLFKQKAGLNSDDHDIDIYGIAKLVGYKPLGLVLAARAMVAAKQTPGDYFKNLQEVQRTVGDGTTAAIALSYRALNNALQGLILVLGATFRGEGSQDYIAAVSNVPEETIQQVMTVLAQLYLVEKFERYGKPYYRLHPAIYEFAQAALKGKNQLEKLQKQVHDATVEYVRRNTTAGSIDHTNLAKEMDNFIAAARWAARQGNRDTANQFVALLTRADEFILQRGYRYELLQLRHLSSGSTSPFPAYEPEMEFGTGHMSAMNDEDLAEMDAEAAYDFDEEEDDLLDDFDDFEEEDDLYDEDDEDFEDELEDAFGVGDLLDEEDDVPASMMPEDGIGADLRTEHLTTIDLDQLKQALAQARQQNNPYRVIQLLKAIGKVQVSQGRETQAITTYNELLEQYEQTDDQEGILDTLNMLSALLTKTGNTQAAIMHATRGVQLAQRLNEQATYLQILLTLGDARQELGESGAAVESYSKALEIARQTDDTQNEAIALYKLGYAQLDSGETDDAIHSLEQARSLFKAQEKRAYEGRVLGGLGSAHSELEEWTEAIGYYQSALHIAREVQDKQEEQLHFSNLAQAQEESNRLPDALLSYRRALHLAFISESRDDIVSTIVDLVRLLTRSKRHLDICTLLLNEAVKLDPDDRDVKDLQQRIEALRQEATAQGIQQAPVNGTAQLYAANAYAMLDQ